MKLNELRDILIKENFIATTYSLDGYQSNALCLSESLGFWRITYYEWDARASYQKDFYAEDDACDYFYRLMKLDPTTQNIELDEDNI